MTTITTDREPGERTADPEQIHEVVRERYAGAALSVLEREEQAVDTCCGPDCCDPGVALEPETARQLYSQIELDEIPSAASLASLGCGNPVAVAELH